MVENLFDTGFDLVDRLEIERIGLDLFLHGSDRTHDCRVISSAELSSNIIVCGIQKFPAQIHRDLSGIGDVLGTVGGCDLLFCEVVIITYRLTYRRNG